MILPPGETIVETKKCRISGEEFYVTDYEKKFYEMAGPVIGGKKYAISSPSLCPDERQRNRLVWRNDRVFYKRKCDKTGKEFVSTYSPDKPFVVYEPKVWWSDDWNPLEYGRKVDFSRTFFDQYRDFMQPIPRIGIDLVNCENSDYCNYCGDDKDCYLDIAGEGNFKSFYNLFTKYSQFAVDTTFVYSSTNMYECIYCYDSSMMQYCMHAANCDNCLYSFNLKGCSECIFCSYLRSKKFYIFNKEYSPEEYRKMKEHILTHREESKEQFLKIFHGIFYRDYYRLNCENCLGDNLSNSKNCFYCFNVNDSEECRNLYDVLEAKHCQDMNYSLYHPEWDYNCISSLGLKSCVSCMATHNCRNCYYCDLTNNSQNCFGCIGIKHGNQMIFNTSYSAQEYEEIAGKIIDHMRSTGEWGEFFPHQLSPIGYNETVAQEYFPMTEEVIKAKGWNWYTESVKTFEGASIQSLSIDQYDEKVVGFETAQKNIDALLSGIIVCEVTKKPFKIIRQELAFYIENRIPIPKKHPDQRHKERMALRNPRKLFERNCSECKKDIITTYPSNRPEKVVCEECYRKLVY